MWHRREHMIFQPLAVGEHALLMTARAEVTGLAGVGEQIVAAALQNCRSNPRMTDGRAEIDQCLAIQCNWLEGTESSHRIRASFELERCRNTVTKLEFLP